MQIGQPMKDRLEMQTDNAFTIKSRGTLKFKVLFTSEMLYWLLLQGKGEMPAYEVVSKNGRPRYAKHPPAKVKRRRDEWRDGMSNSDCG